MQVKNIFSNRNIILLMGLVFVVWLLFFDRNNIVGLREVDDQITELEAERDFLRAKIHSDSTVIEGVERDSLYLERYARENFYKMRAGEVLYIYR